MARAALSSGSPSRGRTCRYCHSLIDPVDYCIACARGQNECWLHEKTRRGPRAAFCDPSCRERYWRERRRTRPSARHGRCKRTLALPGLIEKGDAGLRAPSHEPRALIRPPPGSNP